VPTVASVVDLVVHCELQKGGQRRVTGIAAPTGRVDGGVVEYYSLFELRGGMLAPTGLLPARRSKFESAGLDPALLLGPA
jgi:pilus assembly protein CpaF